MARKPFRAGVSMVVTSALVFAGAAVVPLAAPVTASAAEPEYVFNNAWTLVNPGSSGTAATNESFRATATKKATTVIPLSTGAVNVTADYTPGSGQVAGTNYIANATNHGTKNPSPAMFIGSPANASTLPGLGLVSNASNCNGAPGTAGHQNFDGLCGSTGQFTLTFSKPVTDVVMDVSGLGGFVEEYEKINTTEWARGSFVNTRLQLLTNGVTLVDPSPGRTNFAVQPKLLSVASSNAYALCNEKPVRYAGTNRQTPSVDTAGCGSVVLKGTFTSVTFRTDTDVSPLSSFPANVYGTGSLYRQNRNDGYADGINGLNSFNTETVLTPNARDDAEGSDHYILSLRLPERNQLGDYVWFDTNGNGQQNPNEPAVPGVKVELLDGNGNPVDGDGDGAVDATTTDAQGKYLFTGLVDGTYRVRFTAPNGRSFTTPLTGNTATDSNAQADGVTGPVTLGPGKRTDLTIDAGLVPKPTNTIGDFVWSDTNGNGVQDPGEPGLPGVTVKLSNGATTTTDADGKYLFGGLDDGTYSVCFTLPAGYAFSPKDAGGDDAKDSDADGASGCTATTTVGPGKRQDLTLDAGMVPPSNRIGDYVWADTNRNGVQDAGEPAIAGVTVNLSNGATTTTDANGKYLFDKLPDGTYTVCFDVANLPAQYQGYLPTRQTAGGDPAKDSNIGQDGCSAPTTLGPAKREDLTIDAGLRPPNRLGDFVWADSNKNGLQDAGEPGVPGVTVKLSNGATTTTDANGKYEFNGLPDGTYTVCFDLTSLSGQYADFVATGADQGDDTKDSDADPATGCAPPTTLNVDKPEDLTIDLGIAAPANRIGDFVWIDTNKNGLQDAGEPGVPGVTVKLSNGATTTTDANGKYLFEGMPDGTYTVCFDLSTLPSDYRTTKANAGDDAKDSDADSFTGCTFPVAVGPGKRQDLDVDMGLAAPPNRLGDFVWADTNRNGVQDAGEPAIAGVTVKLNTGATTTTDANGKYLFDDLPDGTYTVCFDVAALPGQYQGWLPTRQAAAGDVTKDSDIGADGCSAATTLGPNSREDLTIDAGFRPPNRLGDFVWVDSNKNGLQDSGEPGVPGVTVKLSNGATTTTDANGKYEFTGLPDGTYTVCFDVADLPGQYADFQAVGANAGNDDAKDSDADPATGCAPPTTLNVDRPEDLTIDLGIAPPVNRIGDFVWIDLDKNGLQDAGEPGVPGVTVKLSDGRTTTTDDNGKYLFEGMPDGRYTVCFDLATLPSDFVATKANAGDDAKDSDADTTTGCAPETGVGPGAREDLTIDLGLAAPPNTLGDFVWADTNRNGVQDAGEPGIPGVTVKVGDRTTTTDANGKYEFTDLPDGTYTVCFDVASLPQQYQGHLLTRQGAGDSATDSNAGADGCSAPTSLGPNRRTDLTIDAGFRPPNRLGDFVWADSNKNGLQDAGEPGVAGVTVKLDTGATTTTDANGKYEFNGLPDGTYTVCFDLTSLSGQYADFIAVAPNRGDDAKDSDADPATGCAESTTLGIDRPEDLTIDLGIEPPVNRIGDYVWADSNKNGLQDAGEAGVPGVAVKLSNGATTTTDENGKYLFEGMPDGTYTVCFDVANLPASYGDYTLTTANAGDEAKDSDADPVTGCTAEVAVGLGKREDLDVDAGLVAPPNTLGDFVWADTNRNGVQDPGEPGIPGVIVKVGDRTTTTDANGKYEFTDLPDGTYTVCFDVVNLPAGYEDHLVTRQGVGDPAKDSDAGEDGCSAPTSLGPNKRTDSTIDLGLRPPNRIGDFVWADTNGNGVQDAGEPGVAGVTVELSTGATTTTDANGKYEFTGLPDGTYTVCFDVENLPALYADYQVTGQNKGGDDAKDSDADVATGCAQPVTVNIDKPEDLSVDLGIKAPVNRIGDYVWVDTNKNGLQDAGEPGVAGVTVKLSDGKTTTTDENGKYLFEGMPDGTYTVCFDVANLPNGVRDYTLTTAGAGDGAKNSDADPATGCAAEVEVGVGQRENLDVDAGLVAPPNKLGDFVWADVNGNGVQDAGEPGVPGVKVTLKETGATTTTDANGKYEFGGLPDGTYTVCFDIDDLPAQYADYQAVAPNKGGDDAKDSDADVETGCANPVVLNIDKRTDTSVDLGIAPPVNRIGDFVWKDLNGNGLQDEGEPGVPGVTVKLSDGKTTTTDRNGKYLFEGMPDGTYTVCFDVKNLPDSVKDYSLTKTQQGDDRAKDSDPALDCAPPVQVGVGKRENLTVDAGLVAPPNKIGDYVWNDVNRNGIQDPGELGVPGVTVKLVDGKGNPVGQPVKTDANGKYSFDGIPDGTYTVCFDLNALPAAFAGYLAAKPGQGADRAKDSDADPATGCSGPVTVGVGERTNLDVDLGIVKPTNRLGDFVWSDDNGNGIQDAGEPGVPGLPVFLQDGNGKPVAQTTTDGSGKYLFDGLEDGEYQVCFNADPRTGLVNGRPLTRQGAGDNAVDSDADPATGCTRVVKLNAGKRVDLTLDAGLAPKAAPPGPAPQKPNPQKPAPPQPNPPLAWTGASLWGPLAGGLALLLAGAFLVLMTRRREE
ncbi:SdrD B-like domain-containing protein [Lentzea sp. NPDC059081]|uniref:SdrD B-like domain-containing protein n=1 Tax=Lentzea sp. NPDC059081 TaxID=3346719 RepID=UPI003692D80D